MRILHVTESVSSFGGGVAFALHGLATHQCQLGMQVDVASLSDTGSSVGPWEGVQVQCGGDGRFKGLIPSKKFNQILMDWEGDLIHSHGLFAYPSSIVPNLAAKKKIPWIVSPHGMLDPWALNHSKWKKDLFARLFENRHLKGASCIHALCDPERASFINYGLPNPVAVLPNGVEYPESGHRSNNEQRTKTLLYIGRVHPKKGLQNLIKAWAKARRLNINWRLVIAGWDEGGHQSRLKSLCNELGLIPEMEKEGFVQFPGPVFGDGKSALLQSANAFVLTSFSEGLPMSILEAWAYGLPVLMTPECNLAVGFHKRAAIRVETHVESIADGLNTLFEMKDEEREEMGRRGRALVEEEFTWLRVAESMKEVYEWILGGGAKPGCVRIGDSAP